MLVKLGNIWVDPIKIEVIYAHSTGDNTTVDISGRSYLACTEGMADEFAAIINNAIGQSYGDGNEEPEV